MSPSPMADQTFRLPDLGEGLTEAQLVTWRVDEGAHVEVNAPLCDVETAKAVVIIPSPWAGTIRKLHARPGESVAVGSALVTAAIDEAIRQVAFEVLEPLLGGADEARVRARQYLVGLLRSEEELGA